MHKGRPFAAAPKEGTVPYFLGCSCKVGPLQESKPGWSRGSLLPLATNRSGPLRIARNRSTSGRGRKGTAKQSQVSFPGCLESVLPELAARGRANAGLQPFCRLGSEEKGGGGTTEQLSAALIVCETFLSAALTAEDGARPRPRRGHFS